MQIERDILGGKSDAEWDHAYPKSSHKYFYRWPTMNQIPV